MPQMSRYPYQPIDSSAIRTRPAAERMTKVSAAGFAGVYQKGSGVSGLIDTLPGILAGSSFRKIVEAMRFGQSSQPGDHLGAWSPRHQMRTQSCPH